ncbi:MAG: tyrosine-type recombinase/integrase [Acidimicrobiales bacterium]
MGRSDHDQFSGPRGPSGGCWLPQRRQLPDRDLTTRFREVPVAQGPRGLSRDQVAALLASCDRARPIGRRDYAILVLLARLGLRAAEVATLRLDDIDWRAGEIVVRGKGRTEERLPLPCDVGEAIAAYIREDRPQGPEREVFLRVCAPLRGWPPRG